MLQFACDGMLGRLAKWMRALGIDTFYQPEASKGELLRTARRDNRIVLTTCARIREEPDPPDFYLVQAEEPSDQLREVLAHWPRLQAAAQPFTRCMLCNSPLDAVAKAAIAGDVPARIWQRFDEYHFCPSCQKVYWHGGHVEQLSKVLAELTGA